MYSTYCIPSESKRVAKLKKVNYKSKERPPPFQTILKPRNFQISWNFYGSGYRDTKYKKRSLVHNKVTPSAAARTRLLFRFVRNPSTAMHFHWPLAAKAFILTEATENA